MQQELKNRILEQDKLFLAIEVTETQLKTNIESIFFPNTNLQFERHIYQNAIFSTEISVEKMKRIISKRIKINGIGKESFTSLMNFGVEESELKENIIKKELINFYEASKRTFNILIRLRNIESMGFPTNLSERTLFQTIAYKQASLERIFLFIFAEWNIDFTGFMDHNKISNFSDTLESLWG
jgi:hypothetical protein